MHQLTDSLYRIHAAATIEKISSARKTRQSFDSHSFAVRPSMTTRPSLSGNVDLTAVLINNNSGSHGFKDLEKG